MKTMKYTFLAIRKITIKQSSNVLMVLKLFYLSNSLKNNNNKLFFLFCDCAQKKDDSNVRRL